MDEKREAEENESSLVPKSLFGDCKVGNTYKVKVVGIYDDEVEIEHVSEKKESKDYAMADAESEMDDMANET